MGLDIQSVLDAMIGQQVDKMCAEVGQWTLGQLVEALKRFPADKWIRFDSRANDEDEDGLYPYSYDSYRGYYRLVAVSRSRKPMLVGEFLDRTEAAIGATYTGYKGGDFTMNGGTPVWVSEYGRMSGVGIVGIDEIEGMVILKTAVCEDDE